MDEYLSRLKYSLDNVYSNDQKQLHVVIGNEACDMDSAASALVLAYLLYWQGQNDSTTVYIPVLNIPRNEYRLKTEVKYVLTELFGSSVENWLIFVDEVRFNEIHERGRLQITLVDHHKLNTTELNRLGPAVRRIVDHHIDKEPEHLSYRNQCSGSDDGGFNRYEIDTVGSCASLVADRVLKFAEETRSPILDEKVAKLLLSAILIDTDELKDNAKTTERDIDVVKRLETLVNNYDREQYFNAVKEAKRDISGMTAVELLAKDYKGILRSPEAAVRSGLSSIGMSTVPSSFENLAASASNGDIASDFEAFRKTKGVDALVLIFNSQNRKHVVVFGGSTNDKDRIYGALSTIKDLGLELSSSGDQIGQDTIRVYRQTNAKYSRKQLLPKLEEMLNGHLVGPGFSARSISTSSKSGDQDDPSSSISPMSPASGGQQNPSRSSMESNPSPDQNVPSSTKGSGTVTNEQHRQASSRARRFLDSTDLARSFSVTYDDDEEGDPYFVAAPAGPNDTNNEARAIGQLARIEETQVPSSTGSMEYEFENPDRSHFSSYSHSSPTDDEVRHYPTVSTPYAASSYDGGAPSVANGSGNTHNEESGATLSGVPDLLDSRENLMDVVAGISEDTPDLLVDNYSPSSINDVPHAMVSAKRSYDDYGDVDLLQGTETIDSEIGYNEDANADSSNIHAPMISTESSLSSWSRNVGSMANYGEATSMGAIGYSKRELSSEPHQFDFSSDPSPAHGRSRTETPPSREEADFKNRGDSDENDFGLKAPGAITPPNTYVERYLDENPPEVATATGRRQSQQSELEPELLYMKLKGTKLLSADNASGGASPSSALLSQGNSVPGTPPNSFIGTPMSYLLDSNNRSATNVLEPESLCRRVTELKKNLPPEDVEYQENNGVGIENAAFMDEESIGDPESCMVDQSGGDTIPVGDMKSIIAQFADQVSRDILPVALAEVYYPELAPSTNTAASGSSGDGSLPDVLTKREKSHQQQPFRSTLSAKSSSDLLKTDAQRPLPFDLVSCSSVASFGRESTVAHADSTEFNIGPKKTGGSSGEDVRVKMDFNDDDDGGADFVDDGASSENVNSGFGEEASFQSGPVGIQWEEEGYPALLDIHQHDPDRIFSDEPGGFDDIPAIARPTSDVVDSETEMAAPGTFGSPLAIGDADTGDADSVATESGPDSPDTESADEEQHHEDDIEGPSSKSGRGAGEGLEWENDTPVLSPQKASQQWSAAEDLADERRWRTVTINGVDHQIDMAAVEPYRRVISHGGYYGEGLNAIAVFASCYLPSRNEPNYQAIMDNLFLYAVSMLDTLVAEDYVIIYFQGGSSSDQMPPFSWLRKCYHLIDRRHVSHTEIGLDRRLRKNLKSIFLVHPTLWLKTVVMMAKPFISSKFSKKILFVQALNDLGKVICMDQVEIPDEVLKYDHDREVTKSHTNTSISTGWRSIKKLEPDANGGDESNRHTSVQANASASANSSST